MIETRGRPSAGLRTGGGTIRDIDKRVVADCFNQAFDQEASLSLAGDMVRRLSDRVVFIDAPTLLKRGHEKRLEQIKKSANMLRKALYSDSEFQLLLLEVQWDPSPISDDLPAWLVRLSNLERYFDNVQPSDAYSRLYQDMAKIITDNDIAVTISAVSPFIRFLSSLEDQYPLLIFAPGRAPQGRAKLVERALKPLRQMASK